MDSVLVIWFRYAIYELNLISTHKVCIEKNHHYELNENIIGLGSANSLNATKIHTKQ